MDIRHPSTICALRPRRVCAAALLALGLSAPAQGEGLEALVGAVLAAVQADGSLDLTGFSCVQSLQGDDTIHDCRDPASGLGFMHLRDSSGDAMSVSIEKGASSPARSGVLVADRAAFDGLEAEFLALGQSPLIQGLTRCAPPTPGSTAALIVRAEPSGVPVALGFGRLDDASNAALDAPGNDGAILSAIVMPILTDYDCRPYDP